MGQYYYPVSLDAKEYAYSHDFGSGLKIMEHSYVGNYLVETIAELLQEGNAWHKTRIVWAGDYGEEDQNYYKENEFDEDIVKLRKKYKQGNSHYRDIPLNKIKINLYTIADQCFEKIKSKGKSWKNYEDCTQYYYNDTKKEYFSIKDCEEDKYHYKVNPLPLLTCNCNHSGGSYYGNDEEYLIGTWAGDIIFTSNELVDGYDLIIPNFIE